MAELRVVAVAVDPRMAAPGAAAGNRRAASDAVWVGPAEAIAIELERRHVPTPRPTTHQLIGQVISACGHRLPRVCVTMVRDGVFHAELVIGPDVRVSARVTFGRSGLRVSPALGPPPTTPGRRGRWA